MAIGLAGALGWHSHALAVSAETPENPYAGIMERNVFALKPKPAAPGAETATVVPAQKIILQGIVSAFGRKQILFKTTMPAKPGEAAKEASFMLSEGERAGEIEVLEINDLAGTVKFNNHGTIDPKSLEKDGMKPTGSSGAVPGYPPGASGIPGSAALPGGPMNTGILTPGGAAPAFGVGGATTIQRPLRSTPPPPMSVPAVPAGVPAQTANVPAKPAMSPEEQIVLMEINRKLTAEQVARGEMPPLPPTPITGQ